MSPPSVPVLKDAGRKTRDFLGFSASYLLRGLYLEAPPRFELGHEGFADLCLTAWLWRRQDSFSIANARAFVKSLPNSFFRRFWVLSGRAGKSGGAPAGGGTIRCDRGNHGTGKVCGRGTGRHRAGMLREETRARYFLYVGALKWGWRQTRSRG